MKIVVDAAIPLLEGLFEPYAEVLYCEGVKIGADIVRDADALIVRTRTRCNAALLEGSRVKIIATATIGFDHIDMDFCRTHGIEVCTAAGCNARGVLQWVAAVLAMCAAREGFVPAERTLGIVGVGNVGRIVKQAAEAWGFRTICCDPPREERERCGFVALEDVLRKADILTFHVPLDDTTRHMLGRHNISLLSPSATIINASRGEVIQTEVLVERASRCAVDVWEHEPDIDRQLLAGAFVTTPHIAGYSLQGKANATAMAVRAVARALGLPLTEWYPQGVKPTVPRQLRWEEMCSSVTRYCDLAEQSLRLKQSPESFEQQRDEYNYRHEYF